jgi:hypothetical protein
LLSNCISDKIETIQEIVAHERGDRHEEGLEMKLSGNSIGHDDMDRRGEADGIDPDRRAALLLGVLGGSAIALSFGRSALAQQAAQGQATELAPGVTRRVIAEVPSVVSGFAKVRLVEVTWQPGGKLGPSTMKDAMICEMSAGALDETKNGQPVQRKTGDVWTCAVGDVDNDVNNGSVPATMRIFSLIEA